MIVRRTRVCMLAACVCLLTTFLPADALPPGGSGTSVTTSLNFSYSQCEGPGELRARFHATPASNGTWQIQATYREQNVRMFGMCWGCSWGESCNPVHGTASATVAAAPGVPIFFEAYGMQAAANTVAVTCNLTVDASGVVSVNQIYLHWM